MAVANFNIGINLTSSGTSQISLVDLNRATKGSRLIKTTIRLNGVDKTTEAANPTTTTITSRAGTIKVSNPIKVGTTIELDNRIKVPGKTVC